MANTFINIASSSSVSSVEVALTFFTPTGPASLAVTGSPVMRLRKVGDIVFCSLPPLTFTSFTGTTGQGIQTQAGAIPAGYRPSNDDVNFSVILYEPAQTGLLTPQMNGLIYFYKDAAYNGFTNLTAVQIAGIEVSWCTGSLDA